MTLSETLNALVSVYKNFLRECADAMEPGVPQAKREEMIRRARSYFDDEDTPKKPKQK